MKIGRIELRWTLGRLMLVIALVAVTLAWYVQRVREIDRERAAADAERDLIVVQTEQILKTMEDQANREQEHWAREIARAKNPPPPPSIESIPGQVRNLVKLLDERAKLEAESERFREEVRAKIQARMEKERLEKAASRATTPPAPLLEDPR